MPVMTGPPPAGPHEVISDLAQAFTSIVVNTFMPLLSPLCWRGKSKPSCDLGLEPRIKVNIVEEVLDVAALQDEYDDNAQEWTERKPICTE